MKIQKLAAIDIGSNAVRLLINTIYQDQTQVKFNKTSLIRVPVRLGKEVFQKQEISLENTKRLSDAIQSFRIIMDLHQVEDYLAFATSAMREAKNGERIIQDIFDKTNVKIDIISGKKEANIIFKTELKEYINSKKNYLYVDVGGGSTELTLLKDDSISMSKSFPVGTVRLLQKNVSREVFPQEMKQWIMEYIKDKKVELIGSGGNINFLYKRSRLPVGIPMEISYLIEKYNQLKKTTYDQRLYEYDMKPDRADVILPALEIFTEIAKWSKAKLIHVPKIGLSDGMIQYLYASKREE